MWFLLIPPVAVLLALAWFTLRSRPDRTSEAMITIEGYRRSLAALARPIPAAHEISTTSGSSSVTTLPVTVPVPAARPADRGPAEAVGAVAEGETGGTA
ncbi:hypothetical protein CcI49_31905 [Frankia sp. CcI49]|uniref:hypothetical protein n=1 Tax=unclassified Frankia TaxID=2632575 RepID=UPI0006CA3621|nr:MULTISPECIES: hypothetical protein [unclassified Frankia]KPM57393.1 hypothetical protein ACG83_06700 [Frankia sp. R43]ONH53563.1 hypothetical protein CcI49_31905 [Frankia sp. CcI49]